MRIGIIGAGNVGRALGAGWARLGHEVVYGARVPDDAKHRDLSAHATLDTVANAARADVLVLATPWEATEAALRAAGDLGGKVLIDCTNPLEPGLADLKEVSAGSAGEQVALWARDARVVKAFNTVGSMVMQTPAFEGGKAVMLICGDDDDAKKTVTELSDALGFETLDAGPLRRSHQLESFALLWITAAFQMGLGWDFAFGLLRR